MLFLVHGLGYGRGAKTLTGSTNIINAIVKTFNGLGGLIFLMLLIAQFITYFNYSNMSRLAATGLADALGHANIGALPLLIGFILLVFVIDIIMPGVIPKWAIIAPIFIPLFYNLGIAPQTVIAAYRVGDGPVNVITPLMVYLPFIILVCQRYRRSAGMGTVVSMMMPYTVVVLVAWTIFFVDLVPHRHPVGPRLAGTPLTVRDGRWMTRPSRCSSSPSSSSCSCGTGCRWASSRSSRCWRCGPPDSLPTDAVLAGFGDPVVVFIATLFVVSEGIDSTGVTTWLGQLIVAKAGETPRAADRRHRSAVRGADRAHHAQRVGRRAAAARRRARDADRPATVADAHAAGLRRQLRGAASR